MHLADIFLPFAALGLDDVIRDMRSKSCLQEFVLLKSANGFAKIIRQAFYSQTTPLSMTHFKNILIHRGTGIHLLANPFHSRGQYGRETEIRIAGRIGKAKFTKSPQILDVLKDE